MAAIAKPNLSQRITNASRELKLFAIASLTMGMAYSVVDATFNNFLNDRYAVTAFQRSFLEFPRELPGFLVVFVSAALWFLCSRRLGGISLLLGVAGAVLMGFAAPSYAVMVVWLFVYSMGQHLMMPVAATVGMDLANEGQIGRRLGQFNAIRNLAAIFGSFMVFVGFRFLGFSYEHTFTIAAIGLGLGAVMMFSMQTQKLQPAGLFLKLHKEYNLYYIMAVLSGSRKQLFITFAPWVLVTIFKQPTAFLATLITAGGIIGILFQPLLGWMIDRFGEKAVLSAEAVLLVFVCLGYGFARFIFPEGVAFGVVVACYLLDQMLMSVGMARSTYIKKIAMEPTDVQPALTVSVTIDHIFSISAALLGGLIWNAFGYQYVFLLGIVIAGFNFLAASRIKLPAQQEAGA